MQYKTTEIFLFSVEVGGVIQLKIGLHYVNVNTLCTNVARNQPFHDYL